MTVARFFFLLGSLSLLSFLGCSQDSSHGRVSGTVLMDGQPVANAQVEFVPVAEGSTSYGRTDDQGRYSMEYARDSAGASVGENEVRITTGDMDVDENERLVGVKETIPAKYNMSTELTFTVKPGSNTADFELTSGGEIVDTTADAAEGED